MIDRKMGPGSTARRFVNLSQFGGPARRVKPEEAVDEGEERHTPVLMRKYPGGQHDEMLNISVAIP
jgi:hypothetical protein